MKARRQVSSCRVLGLLLLLVLGCTSLPSEDAMSPAGFDSVESELRGLRVGMTPRQVSDALGLTTHARRSSFASSGYEHHVYALDDGARIQLSYLTIKTDQGYGIVLHTVRLVEEDQPGRDSGRILLSGGGHGADSRHFPTISPSRARGVLAALPKLREGMALRDTGSVLALSRKDCSSVLLNTTGFFERYDLPDGRAVVLHFDHGFTRDVYTPRYDQFRILEGRK